MATNGNISGSFTNQGLGFVIYLYWSVLSQSASSNSSSVQYRLTGRRTGGIGNAGGGSWTVTINGTSYSGTAGDIAGTEVQITSGTVTIPHNADGTKTFSYSFDYKKNSIVKTSASGTGELDRIWRYATVSSATNFTDEGNPTVYYSNPAGTDAEYLEACISFTGANDDISYRSIPKTGTSYTFNLTGSERSVLWEKLDEGLTSTTVRFYVRTTIDGEEFYQYTTATLTFVNYKPVLTPIVVDSNSDTLRLTGDENTLVQYMSVADCDAQAVARKGAYVDTESIRNGTTELSYAGTIEGVRSNTFYFSVTDSRGYTTNDAVVFNNLADKKWIPYVKLSCSFTPGSVNANGELEVTITGKYFNGSFGAANNRMIVEYKIYPTEGYGGSWTYLGTDGIVQPTVDDEYNYTHTFKITGLSYNQRYNLTVRVGDELMTATTLERVIVSADTLFDWGQTDFNFNVPVLMNRGYVYPQTILWSGGSQMGKDETITLDKPISSQPTGVVLVFSLYRNGAIEDASIHTFFISRTETEYLFDVGSYPRTFMMGINSNLSVFGSKYIYVSDTQLRGFEGNTNSGTAACGITFDNSKFVLRYVIGV